MLVSAKTRRLTAGALAALLAGVVVVLFGFTDGAVGVMIVGCFAVLIGASILVGQWQTARRFERNLDDR